jgi:hypothetical protein
VPVSANAAFHQARTGIQQLHYLGAHTEALSIKLKERARRLHVPGGPPLLGTMPSRESPHLWARSRNARPSYARPLRHGIGLIRSRLALPQSARIGPYLLQASAPMPRPR